jgi:uncharacterized protein (DUF1697 family)
VLEQAAHDGRFVAYVERDGAPERRPVAVLRRQHVVAARERLRAELTAEIARTAGDEDAHEPYLRRVETWVALLRAVNLGRRNRVPMAELRRVLVDAGFANVRTVIASGNVVFDTARKPSAAAIEELVADAFGVRTTAILRGSAHIRKLASARPFEANAYVAFTASTPTASALRRLEGLDPYARVGHDLVLHFPAGYAAARLTGAVLEKLLGIEVTVRNWRTVEKLDRLLVTRPGGS